MTHTTDPNDPRLPATKAFDDSPRPQDPVYLVLSEAERAQGFVRPLRRTYVHSRNIDHPNGRGTLSACGTATTMSTAIAETYARQPSFYGSTYCAGCHMHIALEAFTWDGTNDLVGS